MKYEKHTNIRKRFRSFVENSYFVEHFYDFLTFSAKNY